MLGSLLCGVSTTMTFLIIARAIQGVGGGGLIALVMIIIAGAHLYCHILTSFL
jgi:MFS family permease